MHRKWRDEGGTMRDSTRGTISTRFLKRTWSKFPLLGWALEEEEWWWSCESHELGSLKLPSSWRWCDSNIFLFRDIGETLEKLGFGGSRRALRLQKRRGLDCWNKISVFVSLSPEKCRKLFEFWVSVCGFQNYSRNDTGIWCNLLACHYLVWNRVQNVASKNFSRPSKYTTYFTFSAQKF